jgi:DNA-binding GntR family transcriptional regulator
VNGPDLLALAETESKNNQRALQDQVIYGHIFDAILEQKLSPGTRLSEERLGELFGVSRTIIRRALSRLAHESVIELRPNRGAVVASPTPREAESVLYARRVAERSIVELATLNARKPGFKKALKALETHIKEEQAALDAGDHGRAIRLSGEFHLLLAVLAGNAPLMQFMRSLVSQTSLIIAVYEIPGKPHCSCDEHVTLLTAIEEGDIALALSLMDEHLDHIEAKLRFEKEDADTLEAVFGHLRSGA